MSIGLIKFFASKIDGLLIDLFLDLLPLLPGFFKILPQILIIFSVETSFFQLN